MLNNDLALRSMSTIDILERILSVNLNRFGCNTVLVTNGHFEVCRTQLAPNCLSKRTQRK